MHIYSLHHVADNVADVADVADNFEEIYQKLVLQFVADTNIWELQQEVQQNCCRWRGSSATSATTSATQEMA